MRARIKAQILKPTSNWENLAALGGPETVLIARLNKPGNQQYSGKRLAEIAKAMGQDWIDTAMDLIASERDPRRDDLLPDE